MARLPRGPRRSRRLRWGEEEQRNGRAFAAGGGEGCEACTDEGGGSDLLKLDGALAAVDGFVAEKLGRSGRTRRTRVPAGLDGRADPLYNQLIQASQ